MPRTIAIGDIHGCSAALAALLAAIEPRSDDTIVTLGDYVNRGLDSKGVLEQLIELQSRCQLVPLVGNHDAMMLAAAENEDDYRLWIEMGGIATLQSYGDSVRLDQVPEAHLEFLQSCHSFFETTTHLFMHATYDAALPPAKQDDRHLLWLSLEDYVPPPHCSGKIAIVGHTSQHSGEILDLGYLKCIDTGCVYGGWLTGLDVESGTVWQVDRTGRRRPAQR